LKTALRTEAEKWRHAHSVDEYVLVTSVSMTPGLKDEILRILGTALPMRPENIIGREDLNAMLADQPSIERRHFKLWINSTAVLNRFLNNDILSRTEDLLESIDARARFFVQTDKYAEALQSLDAKKACIISGSPGVGKSLLAEMLILTHSRDGFEVVPISADISEGHRMWNPAEPQIFYYDDFLGQTNLAESLAKNEDDRLANFISKVERSENKRFVLTTRAQILRTALDRSDRVRRTTSLAGRTVVSIDDYNFYAKGRILYNHLYFSRLPMQERREISRDDTYLDVIGHPNYSPRIIEQVLRRSDTSLADLYSDLWRSLDNPEDLWMSSYNDLSDTAQRILRTLATHPQGGAPEPTLRSELGPNLSRGAYTNALKVLEGTWIRIHADRRSHQVDFANPSCRDFVKETILGSDALAEEAIATAATVERLALLHSYSKNTVANNDRNHSSLAHVLHSMGAGLGDRVAELYTSQTSQPPDPTHVEIAPNTYMLRRVDPRPSLLNVALRIGNELTNVRVLDWVDEQVEDVINSPFRGANHIDSEATLDLAYSLVGAGRSTTATLRDLVEYAIENIDTVKELANLLAVAESVDVDVTSRSIQQAARGVLREQIELLLDENDDADIVTQGADAIIELADGFGMDMSREVDVLQEKAHHMPDKGDYHSGPAYQARPALRRRISDEDAVRELFEGLAE
jgi:hypothetical protein